MQPLNLYEIHFVHHDKKKVIVHPAEKMTAFDAWVHAAIECGVPRQLLPPTRFFSLLVTTAEGQGVTKVRWNLSP